MLKKLPYFILGGVALVGTIFLLAIWVVSSSQPESLRVQLAREDQIINDLLFYGRTRQVATTAGLLLTVLFATVIVVAVSRRVLSWGKKGRCRRVEMYPECMECPVQHQRVEQVPKAALPEAVTPSLRDRVSSWVIPEEVEVL